MSIYEAEKHYKSKAYLSDLKKAQDERLKIIECLRANVSEEDKEIFRQNIKVTPLWAIDSHLEYGMHIRNLLRKNGFNYDAFVMDDNWITWTFEAFFTKTS